MATLRIFSYLPNPRVWKATIAAEICDVEVELVGGKPRELASWLWDYDARPLEEAEKTADSPHARTGRRGFKGATLYKTDAFLEAHPFGTVPAAFSRTGEVGIFESNSILRAVARLGRHNISLYGSNDHEASRIDSFLDANLVFARESQEYLLALQNGTITAGGQQRMADAFDFYLNGTSTALERSAHLATPGISIADISFACDLAQFLRERFFRDALDAADLEPIASVERKASYRPSFEHLETLLQQPAFARSLAPYMHKEPVA